MPSIHGSEERCNSGIYLTSYSILYLKFNKESFKININLKDSLVFRSARTNQYDHSAETLYVYREDNLFFQNK
jgi:hypothetical protein